MTKEKELLLRDLCARLPYHPVIRIYNESWEGARIGEFDNMVGFHHVEAFLCDRIEVLPYLRSMSSMTEEEVKEYHSIWTGSIRGDIIAKVDFYLRHHLDFRLTPEGLSMIEKGLALEAPEGMYKT